MSAEHYRMSKRDQILKFLQSVKAMTSRGLADHFVTNENTVRGILVRLRRAGNIESFRQDGQTWYRIKNAV